MPSTFTTWSNTMRKFLAVCRRLESGQMDDRIGVAGLFALIPLILSFGGAK